MSISRKQFLRNTELYLNTGIAHGLSETTGFGTNETDQDIVQEYLIARGTTFFQAIITEITGDLMAAPVHNQFENCANYRKGIDICNNDCDENTCL